MIYLIKGFLPVNGRYPCLTRTYFLSNAMKIWPVTSFIATNVKDSENVDITCINFEHLFSLLFSL